MGKKINLHTLLGYLQDRAGREKVREWSKSDEAVAGFKDSAGLTSEEKKDLFRAYVSERTGEDAGIKLLEPVDFVRVLNSTQFTVDFGQTPSKSQTMYHFFPIDLEFRDVALFGNTLCEVLLGLFNEESRKHVEVAFNEGNRTPKEVMDNYLTERRLLGRKAGDPPPPFDLLDCLGVSRPHSFSVIIDIADPFVISAVKMPILQQLEDRLKALNFVPQD